LELREHGQLAVAVDEPHGEVELQEARERFRGPWPGQDVAPDHDEIDPRAIVPYIDASLAPPSGTRAIDVQVRGLPAGVEVAEIIPASVLVGIKGKP